MKKATLTLSVVALVLTQGVSSYALEGSFPGFDTSVTYATTVRPGKVVSADFNGDNALDLAVGRHPLGGDGTGVSLLFNRENRTFAPKVGCWRWPFHLGVPPKCGRLG